MFLHLTKRHKKELFDYVLYFFVFTTPLFELPQAIEIYSNRSADDVAIVTWVYFLIANIAWLAYAIRHKLKPLLLTYSLYMVIEAIIVIGIVMYR